jgi:hypothetical protein
VIEIPDFATHYHLPDKRPFLNLSDLPSEEVTTVLDELMRRRASEPAFKRVFGRRYMQLREMTEAKLRTLFEQAGGRTERRNPHYFILGRSEWFKSLHPGTREVTLALSELPSAVSSFTYPDSFTAMALGPQFGLPHVPRPYHEKVFRLWELRSVVGDVGLPADATDDHEGYERRPFEKYVEIQLWSDEPVRRFLECSG